MIISKGKERKKNEKDFRKINNGNNSGLVGMVWIKLL